MTHSIKRLGILVGGGPAPGINSVIGAATIRGVLAGFEVIGLRDGFQWLMQGNIDHTTPLTIDNVSRIHFRGGSFIGISRANPTKSEQLLENTVISLLRLNIDKLITIGGDDTAFSAYQLEQHSKGRIRVVHVPKTIDNDLDLPAQMVTFGYQTARHIGVEMVKNLMVDAKTTSRWYFVVTMGRKAGHLALGIGKSAGASLTLIPEEFQGHVTLKRVVDTLAGAIIKRLADGRPDGVAILAEGLVEGLSPEDLTNLAGHAERDAHDNLRIAEVDFGEILKAKVLESLKKYGLKPTIVAKNIGYELRCADPVPFDMEYTRDLGYCAAKYLDEGGSGVMVTMQQDAFQPLPFTSMMDPNTGRTKVRMVDIQAERYKIARRYMIRLRRDDFDDPHALAKYAATARIGLEQFRADYEYLVEDEPLPVQLLRPAAIVKSEASKELPLVETAAKPSSKKGA